MKQPRIRTAVALIGAALTLLLIATCNSPGSQAVAGSLGQTIVTAHGRTWTGAEEVEPFPAGLIFRHRARVWICTPAACWSQPQTDRSS